MCEELSINNIDNYVNGKYSICREERQYALYLSNVLRYYGNPAKRVGKDKVEVEKIFKACGFKEEDIENIVIENVYYEATFMRDFFERNRRINLSDQSSKKKVCLKKTFTPPSYVIRNKVKSFNHKLIEFCINEDDDIIDTKKTELKEILYNEKPEDKKGIKEIHFGMKNGSKEIPDAFKEYKNKIRAMMNSKPDLAVIYHFGENIKKKELLFLECKFESNEAKKDGVPQSEIQGFIAKFLKKYYFTDDISISCMKDSKNSDKYSSNLVQFFRKGQIINKNRKRKTGFIEISSLIDLERNIFDKSE